MIAVCAGVVLHADGEPREDQADDDLADELRLAAEAEAALLGDLDVVVEEADRAQPAEQEQQQQRRRAGRGSQVASLATK